MGELFDVTLLRSLRCMSTKNSNDSLDRILYKSNAKLALDENFPLPIRALRISPRLRPRCLTIRTEITYGSSCITALFLPECLEKFRIHYTAALYSAY